MAGGKQPSTLELSPTSLSFTWEGEAKAVFVTSNTTWEVVNS